MKNNQFFIFNGVDRPSEAFVTELREDGLHYYIHPQLASDPFWRAAGLRPRPDDLPVSLEDYGLDVVIEDGMLRARRMRPSIARYPNGSLRDWQGAEEFEFVYPPAPLPEEKPMTTYVMEISVRHGETETVRRHVVLAGGYGTACRRTLELEAEACGDGLGDEEDDGVYSQSGEFHFGRIEGSGVSEEEAAVLRKYFLEGGE